ncbi:MAG: hypothetical protein AAGD11_01135 [Planctomycetota bacterium]
MPLDIRQAVATIFGCAALGTSVGLVVGYSIGTYAPDFIRALFPLASHESSTTQIGAGLGTVSGGFIGVGVGVFIVGLFAWLGPKAGRS